MNVRLVLLWTTIDAAPKFMVKTGGDKDAPNEPVPLVVPAGQKPASLSVTKIKESPELVVDAL